MKTNKLSATIIVITLVILLPQKSHCGINNSERLVIPLFDKLFKVQAKQENHLRKAITQNTHYYPKNIQVVEFTHVAPTLDKKFVSLKIKAFWKISKLPKYQKHITSYNMAKNLVWDFTEEAVRRVIIAHNLKDIVERSESGILVDMRCSRDIESETIKLSNNNLLKVGIKIVNIETRISYPIEPRPSINN